MNLARARFEAGGLLALSLLLLLLLLWGAGGLSNAELQHRRENLLPVFRPNQVRELRLIRRELNQPLVLTRDPNSPDPRAFSLTYPGGTVAADEAALAGLLSTLEHAPLLRRVPARAGGDEQFGFSSPLLELRAEMGQLSVRLLVGKKASTPTGARYVKVSVTGEEEFIGVVAGAVVESLMQDGQTFLGKLVFRYAQGKTRRLTISHDGETLELVKDALGFRLGPKGPRVARQRVDGLFFQLARTSIDPFSALPAPGQFTEVARITQVPTEGPPLIVRVADSCPSDPTLLWLYRIAPDPVAGCAERTLSLDLDPVALESRRLAPVYEDEVDHVVVDWRDRRIDLVRRGKEFLLQAPEQTTLSLEEGRQYISQLLAITGTKIPEADGPPAGTLRLSTLPPHSDRAYWLELDLLPAQPPFFLVARRKDDGVLLGLPASSAALIDASRGWFETRNLEPLADGEVEEILIERDGATSERLRRRADGFVFDDTSAADDALVEALLSELRKLKAVRLAPKAELSKEDALLQVQVDLRGGESFRLLIGKRTRSGYLARLGDANRSFVVAPEVKRALDTSLRSRQPARLPVEEASSITLMAHGETTELLRDGADFMSPADLLPEQVRVIQEALSELDVVSALPAITPRPPLGRVELRIEVRFSDAEREPLELSFGEVLAQGPRARQRVRADGIPYDFAFDRASILRLLDLL